MAKKQNPVAAGPATKTEAPPEQPDQEPAPGQVSPAETEAAHKAAEGMEAGKAVEYDDLIKPAVAKIEQAVKRLETKAETLSDQHVLNSVKSLLVQAHEYLLYPK